MSMFPIIYVLIRDIILIYKFKSKWSTTLVIIALRFESDIKLHSGISQLCILLLMHVKVPKFGTVGFYVNQYSVVPTSFGRYR